MSVVALVSLTGAFMIGAIAGFALRPSMGRLVQAAITPVESGPGPIFPVLWTTMAAQYRLLDARGASPKIVYLGDSITDWMKVSEFLVFERGQVLNRSVSGDTTLGVLRRVSDSFPDNVEVCFVLVGVIDLSRGAKPTQVARRIEAIGKVLTERGVGHVVIESLLPSRKVSSQQILETNDILRQIPKRARSTTFLDLFHGFVRDGQPDAAAYVDEVHLNERGMLRRVQFEVEHLERVASHVGAMMSTAAPQAQPSGSK
jgi:lysophospholipase L1-like esterase